MARTAQRPRASSSDSAASSASEEPTQHTQRQQPGRASTMRPTPAPSSADVHAGGTRPTPNATSAALAAPAPPSGKGAFTASEVRRQKTLFLGESEHFAFDFGGEAVEVAETLFEADAAQRAAMRAEELADATARVQTGSTAAARPLTLEEVNACAAATAARGPRRFLTLPKPGARKRTAAAAAAAAAGAAEASAPQQDSAHQSDGPGASTASPQPDEDGTEGATLAEAIPQFKAALRRYEADLWRTHKQRREEEDRQQRGKARRGQRA